MIRYNQVKQPIYNIKKNQSRNCGPPPNISKYNYPESISKLLGIDKLDCHFFLLCEYICTCSSLMTFFATMLASVFTSVQPLVPRCFE